MRSRDIRAVGLVILLGLVVGVLGLVAADLYTVGVLILFVGGVGGAVLVGEYLIRYLSTRRPPPDGSTAVWIAAAARPPGRPRKW